jgi:hypothetical protein
MIPIYLATEDALSEAVAQKLLSASGKPFVISQSLGKQGFGYLKTKFSQFNQLANKYPVLLLTDLDKTACVLDLLETWKKGIDVSEHLLFRVVVREIEAWLLADRQNFAKWLGISMDIVPREPETIEDPKQALLNLVKRSKQRNLKTMILPEKRSYSPVGLGYNTELTAYVRHYWDPKQAAESAPSLSRALHRILTTFCTQ